MSEREVLKLALDALGEIEWSNNSQWQSDRAKVAITAIKEALAQPEQEPCGGCEGSGRVSRDPDIGTDQECFVCGGSGAKPEQEPVQTIPSFTQLQQIIMNLEHCLSRDSKQEFLRVWIRDWTEHKLSQNTTPPPVAKPHKRPSRSDIKPLTDEEIRYALESEFLGSDEKRNWQDDLRVARAIEAAHGIKENT